MEILISLLPIGIIAYAYLKGNIQKSTIMTVTKTAVTIHGLADKEKPRIY